MSSLIRSVVDDLEIGVFSLLANTIGGSALVPRILRLVVLRLVGLQVNRAQIRPGVIFTTRRVRVGPGAFVNRGCVFDSHGWVTLGPRVHVGHGVMFCTSSHTLGDRRCRAGEGYAAEIEVKEGCWIGTRAVLLPGVVVEAGCVIAAGAVVTSRCTANGLYAGVPARRVKDLD